MHTQDKNLPEGELIEHAKAGSQPAIIELIRRYKYVVARSAARAMNCWNTHCDMDDLIQEGTEALLDAIRTFDCKQSKTLKPYAEKAIRFRILDYILNRGETIRLSRRALAVIASIETTKQSLSKSLNRTPDFDEVVQATGLPIEAIREAEKWQAMQLIASLDQASNDDETQTIEELIADDTTLTPEQSADSDERIELVHYPATGSQYEVAPIVWDRF